jgi:GNAT superfamily N-acetyltransferase
MPSLELYDANIDFYTGFLLTPEHLQQSLARIAARKTHGDYRQAGPATRRQLTDLSANLSLWQSRIAAADQTLATCRTPRFYDPPEGVQALEDLKNLLHLVSLAYYPAQIGWGTFDHPHCSDPDWLLSFPTNTISNPFAAFCETRLISKLGLSNIHLLLLWVATRDQLPAAATLAAYAKKMHPALPVAAVGAANLMNGLRELTDTRISVPDHRLVDRLTQLALEAEGRTYPQTETGPARERSEIYLTPAKMTAIDLRPGHFSAGRPAGRTNGTTDCREVAGGRGAIIRVAGDFAKYFDNFACTAPGEKGPCALGIRTELHDTCEAMAGRDLYRAGVKLVIWQAPQGTAATLKTIFWQFSRAGIWNHLVLPAHASRALTDALGAFAAANPNIVHSWEMASSVGAASRDDSGTPVPEVYQRVQKLPGRPLWQCLSDPVHLLLYLQKHGREKVMRWRVTDDSRGVYTLGCQLAYHYQEPARLPAGYLDEICEMVADGGSVNMERVRSNLARAFLIAYAVEDGVIVGNSSLKNPRREYIETVNRQSGLDLTHYVERGYTSVRPEYRGMGIGARLLGGLTGRAGHRKVFSVISEDNEAARKMALRNRTKQVAEYYSPRLEKHVGIWIPESMLDDTRQ